MSCPSKDCDLTAFTMNVNIRIYPGVKSLYL
jgi:hypothetical protein